MHEAALAAFGHLQQIEHEMHELEHRMAEADADLEKVLERYSDLQHDFEREGGFEYGAKAEAILQGLGFDRDTWSLETEKLSGGQQNRLGLARLLLAEPDILLLDEPTRGVDVGSKAEIYRLIGELAQQGKAILFVSSYLPELLGVCDRLAVMARGRLGAVRPVAAWTAEQIMAFATRAGDW